MRIGLAFSVFLAATLGACRQAEDNLPARGAAAVKGFVQYPESDYIAVQGGKPGGVLRASTSTDTAILDPHGVSAVYIQWFGRMVFDNLVYQDLEGKTLPWLAESWTISPDGKTYTFSLRRDVTFSDGSRFDAEALRLNFEHMRDPATRSPLAARYIAPYTDGKIVDDFTFEAHLSQPYTPFLNVLAQSWLAILSPKQIRENPRAAISAPIGSGPYILESYTRQQGLRLVRRPDYHWAPPYLKHEGPALIERIEVDIIPEALTRFSGLANGTYDFTFEAPTQNTAAIRADEALVFDKRIRQGMPTRSISFNTERPPLDDVLVRRALAHAIDREGIARIMGFGEYDPKADFLAANTRFYDPSFEDVLRYDLAEANRLLDSADWTGRDKDGFRTKDGKKLEFEYLTTEAATPSPVVVAVQADLRKVGVDVHLAQLPAAQLTDRRNSGDYQALAGGVWHTNTPDVLYILHHSTEISANGKIGQNSSRLRDAALDDLLARARQSSNPAELKKLYSDAQRRLTELVPAVPVYENYTFTAHAKRLHGVVYDTSHNTPIFTAAWIDEGRQ